MWSSKLESKVGLKSRPWRRQSQQSFVNGILYSDPCFFHSPPLSSQPLGSTSSLLQHSLLPAFCSAYGTPLGTPQPAMTTQPLQCINRAEYAVNETADGEIGPYMIVIGTPEYEEGGGRQLGRKVKMNGFALDTNRLSYMTAGCGKER